LRNAQGSGKRGEKRCKVTLRPVVPIVIGSEKKKKEGGSTSARKRGG